MSVNKSDKLFRIAQRVANDTPEFFDVKGAGKGDKATHIFMKRLREKANTAFGYDFSEVVVRKDLAYRFDFYFDDEATVVEIALSLRNPLNEYEKDLFKCLLAKNAGRAIENLILITKPGGKKRMSAPGPLAIAELGQRTFGIDVQIKELQHDEAG